MMGRRTVHQQFETSSFSLPHVHAVNTVDNFFKIALCAEILFENIRAVLQGETMWQTQPPQTVPVPAQLRTDELNSLRQLETRGHWKLAGGGCCQIVSRS
jgi:hypothetical protein